MGILVLIHEPGTFPRFADVLVQVAIHILVSIPRESENAAPDVCGQPAILVIQPDEDVSTGLHERGNCFECQKRIGRVMQDAV